MKASDQIVGLTSKDRLPQNRYVARITEAVFGPSKSSGNNMITLSWEIVAPEIIEVGDRKFNIGGSTFTTYCPVENKQDPAKDSAAKGRTFDLYEAVTGVRPDELDENNPELGPLKGAVLDVILGSNESMRLMDPTPEERANGARYGKPILDDKGQPIKSYQIALREILGPSQEAATVSGTRPY